MNKKKDTPEDQTYYMPIFMCLGMSIGTAIGVATDNMSMGMCLGISFGLCIGSIIDARNLAKSEDKTENSIIPMRFNNRPEIIVFTLLNIK